ncbi:hypothetical protein CVT24_009326 [Panaeolus cyanescens]|uniref:DH domain-containing protein n=1 Tax=Panaeolus cyanescens TaxID=181874 RepID=A0A409Y7U8_9AGAR|nr:hypothetical protein CVT24_009326 [Panaeolus cyanescens]
MDPRNLPPGAQQPAVVTPPSRYLYSLQVQPPPRNEDNLQFHNPWDSYQHPPQQPQQLLPPQTRPRVQSMQGPVPPPRVQPQQQPTYQQTPRFSFPEPQFFSFEQPAPPPPPAKDLQPPRILRHHHSRSDLPGIHPNASRMHNQHSNQSVASFASSYNAVDDDNYEAFDDEPTDLAKGLSNLSLNTEEAIRRFQAGELPDNDQEWHRLVPEEARDALGKSEVQRQSILFEVVKSEREYVKDLEAIEQVFIEPLRTARPPIIRENILPGFINEVFGNLKQILAHHQRILAALMERQREQHPLVQSISDIILDTTLKADFRAAYETYIKHYPLAESHHRNQLKKNHAYELFIQSVSNDPRIRKRDLVTFLSRPVTRLPRLNLLLETILKCTEKEYTEYGHPDLDTLPIILGILKDCIKSTQPGIEAAESKVKFWGLCESLVFQRGEIIDLDLYDKSRSLVYTGSVYRRARSDTGFSEKWVELEAALLDNYLLLLREEKRPNGQVKRMLMSRPMPLSFLRLGSFKDPPDTRKEKPEDGSGGLLDSLRSQTVPIYPFTIYHAASRATRRYTLYVSSDAIRKKWHSAFVEALGIHKVREESNQWFNPQSVTDGFFRVPSGATMPSAPSAVKYTGRIHSAVPFVNNGKKFLVISCAPGVYVGLTNSEDFKPVLNHRLPISLAAITKVSNKVFNRLIVHSEQSLVSYSLDILARVALGQSQKQNLDSSKERITPSDAHITFFRYVQVGGRALVIYASKRRLGSSMTVQVLECMDRSEAGLAPKRPSFTSSSSTSSAKSMSFRQFGDPGYVPKDAHDIVALMKTVGICTSSHIVVADPTNLASANVAVVPDLQGASTNEAIASLKAKLEGKKPLGLFRVDQNELLVVYDGKLSCTTHLVHANFICYIRWEAKADACAHRNGQLLLFSPEFIEVRNITTSRLVQVIEGKDIRLTYSGPYESKDDTILCVMRGKTFNGEGGFSEKVVELVETEEISQVWSPVTPHSMSSVQTQMQSQPQRTSQAAIWDEWDMQ